MAKFLTPNQSTVLITHLNLDDCQERLNNAIDKDGLTAIGKWTDKVAYGQINATTFHLKKRHFTKLGGVDLPSGRDPYVPYLEGFFLPIGSRTEIHCTFTRVSGINWLSGVWFASLFIIFSCVIMGFISSLVSANQVSADNWYEIFSFTFVLLVMVSVGAGRIYFANKAGKQEYDFLIDFLKRVCEAEEFD